MSWNIDVKGTKKGVAAAVEKASAYGDSSQLDLAKKLILDEVARIPEGKGISVMASGHHDGSWRNLSIHVMTCTLELDPPEPSPAPATPPPSATPQA